MSKSTLYYYLGVVIYEEPNISNFNFLIRPNLRFDICGLSPASSFCCRNVHCRVFLSQLNALASKRAERGRAGFCCISMFTKEVEKVGSGV